MKDEGEGSSRATDLACTLMRKKDVPGQTGGILAWPTSELVAVTPASIPTGQPNPLTHSVRIRRNRGGAYRNSVQSLQLFCESKSISDFF